MRIAFLAVSLYGALLFVAATEATAQTVVADWLFDTNLPSNFGGSTGFTGTTPGPGFPIAPEMGSGFATGLHASSALLWSGPAGNGSSRSLNSNGWAVGDYYQFQVATTGAPNVALSWDQTSSNTGPKDFVLQYSLDGTTFTIFGSPFSILANNAPNPQWSPTTNHPEFAFAVDLSSVTAINSQPNVYFRLVNNSTVSANGGSVATAGTARIDNFTVTIGNVVASTTYWDSNGAAVGLGGAGVWDSGTTKNWNDSSGTGTPTGFDPGSLAVFGGTGGTVMISNSSPGTVTANAGLQFDADGYTISGDSLNLGATSKIRVANATDTATIDSKISGSNGLIKNGDGTLALTSTASDFTGNIAINAGTLSISSDANLGATANGVVLGGGTLKSTAAGNLQFSSGRALSGAAGAIDAAAGNSVTIPGAVNTTGALSLPNAGTVALTGSGSTLGGVTFSKGGTLQIGTAGLDAVTLNGSIVADSNNSGVATISGNVIFGGTAQRTISIQNPSAKLVITGGLSSGFPQTTHLIVNGAGTLDIQGDTSGLVNAMQIGAQNTAGPTVIAHSPTSVGNVTFGTVTLFFNSGTITNQSGSLINFGSTLLSSIGGAGNFPATYAGADMEFRGGLNLFRPSGSAQNHITVNNNLLFSGGWTATGDAGTLSNNSGVVFDGTGSVTLSNTSGGDFSAMLVPMTASGVTVNFNGVNPNNNGAAVTIGTSNYTANLQLTASNNGRINLSTANAFAGSGATPAPAKVAVGNGGVVATGGVNQSFGTLTVTGGGTIDLGSGASVAQFSDSHSQTWSGILRIGNWSGNFAGNGADQVQFSGSSLSGLSASQLGGIHFTGFPTGAKLVANGANGELVPLSSTPLLLGDINADSHANATDVPALLTALKDLNAYKTLQSGLDDASLTDILDLNADGVVSNADLQGLITYIKAGHGSAAVVPEPSGLGLFSFAVPIYWLVSHRRRKTTKSILRIQ